MGTEFQYALNPLAENRKNISFTVGQLDDWDYPKGKTKKEDRQKSAVFISFEDSMDKLIEKKNIESIKRTMLTHENIFKHQVSELHRLYNMQKILMNETRNEITKIIEDHIPTTKGSDLKQLTIDKKGQLGEQNPHIARMSVWVGSDTSATNRMADEEEHCRLHTQIVHSSRMYISTENNDSDICKKDGAKYEECDVDLTLGIGGNNKQSKTEGSSSSSSNQKSSLPHWLYQGLGSNKT